MSRYFKKKVIKAILLTFLIMIVPNSLAADVIVSTPNATIQIGQTFNININIDPMKMPVSGAQLSIKYNQSVLKINKVLEGNFFKQEGAKTYFNSGVLNNSTGLVANVFSVILGPSNVSRSGTFLIINATAIGSSNISWINLSNVKISDPNGISVSLKSIKGALNISKIYETFDKIPPDSIKNLKNATYNPYYIKWTWTDPSDPDFSKVNISINGKYITSVAKGAMYYNATGLIPGIIYTISTRTLDIAGNVNSTWVNHSARTMPDKIPPASVKNLKNATYNPYYIKWTWTDPSDPDFSKVNISINGKYITSVAKGAMYYNATGLIPGIIYTISTRTLDIAGNVNSTWVNHSARTMPDKIPPGRVKNLGETLDNDSYINGTVRSKGIVISGVVVATNASIPITTDASGFYSIRIPTGGTHNLIATREPAFYPNSSILFIATSGSTMTQDIELEVKPLGTISGSIKRNIHY